MQDSYIKKSTLKFIVKFVIGIPCIVALVHYDEVLLAFLVLGALF